MIKECDATTHLAYDFIANRFGGELLGSQFKRLWIWNIPLKIKCFSCLCVGNFISTWDNLCLREWIGPNRCCLCMDDDETVNHLFVSYSLIREVRNVVANIHSLVLS